MKSWFSRLLLGSSLPDDKVLNTGWLLFRLHFGLSMAIHAGWPKMNTLAAPGWFNDQVAGLGFTFPSPAFWATLASWGEFAGGLCIALGLFTRFNAIQLAFQFFVISFLWYNEPEPITGMYFQNTLFMGFLLLACGGSGTFSMDHLIRKRKRIPAVAAKSAVAFLSLFLTLNGTAQTVTGNDFKCLEGKWKGALTYLDYSSHQPVTIPAHAEFAVKTATEMELAFIYPDEPSHNSVQQYQLKENNSLLNNARVLLRETLPGGFLKMVTEEKGTDGNDGKPAVFRQEWIIHSNRFTLTKLVKFADAGEFFQRHQYVFTR